MCLSSSSPFLCTEYHWRCSSSIPPQASVHFYKISCRVWIFHSKPNNRREETCGLWCIHRFGFSCFLCDKDPWSLWAESSASTHTEVVISVLGFDHNVNRYISHSQKGKGWKEERHGDQKPAFSAINRAFYIISLCEH